MSSLFIFLFGTWRTFHFPFRDVAQECRWFYLSKRDLATLSRRRFLRGLVGSHFCTARCRETVWAAGPFTAGGGTARPCRLDGDMAALRLLVAVKDRRKTRKALEREWSHRRERLVNQRRSASRTGEVDEKSRGLGLPATTHLACTSGKHLSELEPALSPLLTLSC